MTQIINLPTKNKINNIPVITPVTANLVDNTQNKEILIDSLKYLPEFLQDKAVMKDAAKLLDVIISEENDVLAQIHQAYCDTLYKTSNYQQLSYGAKVALLKENGFGYLFELLKHIYEEKYNMLTDEQKRLQTEEEFLERESAKSLTNLTMLFNLLYILKGKTLGLELALRLVNAPDFLYVTWDTVANYKGLWKDSFENLPLPGGEIEVKKGDAYTIQQGENINADVIFNGVSWHICSTYRAYLKRRKRFTAELNIYGIASVSLQARIAEFVRSYMLPKIEVSLYFTDAMPAVLCFPSGGVSALERHVAWDYIDAEGNPIKKNLTHNVSDEHWTKTNTYKLDTIKMGVPSYHEKAFDGIVHLDKSFVQDKQGNRYYLYGTSKTIPTFITGPALSKLTPRDTLENFDGTYVQAPLQKDYVSVDIVTGTQRNPKWVGNVFERDTIIQYAKCLTVDGIHLAKTVREMEQILIEDFDSVIKEAEVYAGRVTNVTYENPSDCLRFQHQIPWVRTKVGTEPKVYLKYSDTHVTPTKYTGIGDLGILGANSYFIYNGMLYRNDNNGFHQVGVSDKWSDVGASHAVSSTYWTPGIDNGLLYAIKEDDVQLIPVRSKMLVEKVDSSKIKELNSTKIVDMESNLILDGWTHVTGYINDYYTGYAINDGYLYQLKPDGTKVVCNRIDDTPGWTYITGAAYTETYACYGIKNDRLYIIQDDVVTEMLCDGEPLTNWDTSFECISRYHHTNDDYITYAVCGGKLYSIQNNLVELMDTPVTGWTKICGYYNDRSPRTFGYGIANNKLYELKGKQVVLKDGSKHWTDISGGSTSTVTYCIAIADDYLYKVNDKTLEKLDNSLGWTEVFGRYGTSTSKSNTCYGYAIKNKRLYVISKGGIDLVPAMWKVNGMGAPVDLLDYDITDLTAKSIGGFVYGIENIKNTLPLEGEPASNYDIYVTYDTVGFEDNTRYEVKTSMSDMYYIYQSPDLRDDVSIEHVPNGFNERTGKIDNFIMCPLIIHGKQKINGAGDAYEFQFGQSYLEIPEYWTEGDHEHYIEPELIPFTEMTIRIGAIIEDKQLQPIILDKNNKSGIYYGKHDNLSGFFAKVWENGSSTFVRIKEVALDDHCEIYVKYIKGAVDQYSLKVSVDGSTFDTVNLNTGYMLCPKYLGGNGTVFGDGIVFLAESSMISNRNEKMFTNNRYLSLLTNKQNLEELFTTHDTQESQKVIEIQKENGERIIELEMDMMYVSRDVECNDPNLTIEDSFVYNNLHIGENEGTYTSTLGYEGEFTLDPEKAQDVGRIKQLSNYGIDHIAEGFTTYDYINVNPKAITKTNPLVITTGSNVANQVLLQTEESTAYTNAYLLTPQHNATYNTTTTGIHTIPSGIEYSLNTNVPGTKQRTLTFNAERFYIDEEKIKNVEPFNFDIHTALMTGFARPSEYIDYYATIPLDLTHKTGSTINVLPNLVITPGTDYQQKIAQFDDIDILIGNKVETFYDEDGNKLPGRPNYEIPEDTGEDYVVPEYTTKWEEDDTLYPFEPGQEYKLRMDMTKVDKGIKGITKHESTSTQTKDKFFWKDGVADNFSTENYFTISSLANKHGLVLNILTDDDVSKDQGILGLANAQSLCIKDNHYCICDANGNVIQTSDENIWDNDNILLAFRNMSEEEWEAEDPENVTRQKLTTANIFVSYDGQYWSQLFDNRVYLNIATNMEIGYASAGSGMLPFNGKIDLTRSYTETVVDGKIVISRLYDLTQTLKIYATPLTDIKWEEIQEIVTPYAIYDLQFGFDFTGSLDLYKSELILPYYLEWLDNGVPVDIQIKNDMAALDPTYDPLLDPNTYTIEEYGIHTNNVPNRWDQIVITYVTTDKAYYMGPNKTYYIYCDTQEDKDSGKCALTLQGNVNWTNGVISGFTANDYYYYPTFVKEKYLIIKTQTGTDITTPQALCGYNESYTPSIMLKDGKWKYYNGATEVELLQAKTKTNYYFKLYMNSNFIEYSTDGKTWSKTVVRADFQGYAAFTFGTGYIANNIMAPFLGSIDLKESMLISDTDTTYLYRTYQKITPYISMDKKTWSPLVITPMLTLRNMVAFGQGFNGSLDLHASNLLLADMTYWTAIQTEVVAIVDGTDYKAGDVIKTYILDDVDYDPSKFMLRKTKLIRVKPETLQLKITGLPKIGDQIKLDYISEYLFERNNTEYLFRMIYDDKMCTVSYRGTAPNSREYIIYQMPRENHRVNSGYNFWGSMDVAHSTRGGMTLCDYSEWYTYRVDYKKRTDKDYTLWTTFSIERRYNLYKRTGYLLNGPLYMTSSFVKLNNLVTPFLAAWNANYIDIVGGVKLDPDGATSMFTENDYIYVRPDGLKDGFMVSFLIETDAYITDQGIGTLLGLESGKIVDTPTPSNILKIARKNRKYIVEYHINGGKVYARVIDRETQPFRLKNAQAHTLTIIPYNKGLQESQYGYYVRRPDQQEKLKVYYTVPSRTTKWYPLTLNKVDVVDYYGKQIKDIYIAQVSLGYNNGTNTNPDGIEYKDYDTVEYKIISENETVYSNKTVLYIDKMEKQRTIF